MKRKYLTPSNFGFTTKYVFKLGSSSLIKFSGLLNFNKILFDSGLCEKIELNCFTISNLSKYGKIYLVDDKRL